MTRIWQKISRRINSLIFASLCCGKCGRRILGLYSCINVLHRYSFLSSKSYYLKQVHQPRHLAQSARLFGPDYLEVFILTAQIHLILTVHVLRSQPERFGTWFQYSGSQSPPISSSGPSFNLLAHFQTSCPILPYLFARSRPSRGRPLPEQFCVFSWEISSGPY
jgi:hypothetical protein